MNNKQMEMMAREHDMSGVDPELAKEVAEVAVEGAVSGYKKIENAVVTGYKKIEDMFVQAFLNQEKKVVKKSKKNNK